MTLEDAPIGEPVLLVHHVHQDAHTPYRASHAIFVRERALSTAFFIDDVPEALRRRQLSVRAFDANDMMIDADLAQGTELEPVIDRLFANPETSYLHAHFAKRGCYAARIDRT